MATQSKPKENGFNYGDYRQWPEDERWELIDGVPYNMTPAPSCKHQAIQAALLASFFNHLEDKECEVYGAPFDVRLPEGEEKEDEIRISRKNWTSTNAVVSENTGSSTRPIRSYWSSD